MKTAFFLVLPVLIAYAVWSSFVTTRKALQTGCYTSWSVVHRRADDPIAYWTWIGITLATGLVSAIVGPFALVVFWLGQP